MECIMTTKITLNGLDVSTTEVDISVLERNTYESKTVVTFSNGEEYDLSDREQLKCFLREIQSQLEDANKTICDIGNLMVCDDAEIKETLPDFCVEQEVLNKVNAYREKWCNK